MKLFIVAPSQVKIFGTVKPSAQLGMDDPLRRFCKRISVGRCGMVEAPAADENVHRFALEFQRDFIAVSRPCVIKGLISEWPALTSWRDLSTLRHKVTGNVTVALTPNGFADAITRVNAARFRPPLGLASNDSAGQSHGILAEQETNAEAVDVFATPQQTQMSFCAFIDRLLLQGTIDHPRVVAYAQFQNSSLTREYSELQPDILPNVKQLGEILFGTACEAENLWIGTHHSVTTMHRDWSENLYCVVTGRKVFTLIPPWEGQWLPKLHCAEVQYDGLLDTEARDWSVRLADPVRHPDETELDEGDGAVAPDCSKRSELLLAADSVGQRLEEIPWIVSDIADPAKAAEMVQRYPDFAKCHPITVVVEAGETLYIPAMWYHRVAQEESPLKGQPCVMAVNYWFDMQFGPVYHLQQLAQAFFSQNSKQ